MQNIQNSAARLILGQSKFEHITPALQQLHWLPIRYRIQFKIMTIVYKAVHNADPEYICDLFESKQSIHYALSLASIFMNDDLTRGLVETELFQCVRLNLGTLFHRKL